ncbi:phage portal protein [Paenibacillus alvei]|uniref:Phage portal protein n=1 Tax=Paenibacillus alvei TaxID=44250 RepID=A0ABT4GZW7_PAEAL|nr:phage portal protein [Paenibacillus alvei]EJW19154.1 phage portal protein, lambda family [Paenibacillus alvei DSM 29]MCY9541844.1 phage portal protein [Paenibacillus alvei]MCY9706320.1 phage portal protein [Paenibacillus alvei]MCY9732244.1 phage portal protein [Paenibacillus alvei]MCY9756028.1 phage portal protein [Paenibacillus alvei]
MNEIKASQNNSVLQPALTAALQGTQYNDKQWNLITGGCVQNKGYSDAGASYSKKALKGMVPNSGSPREDIDANNFTLRQRSRMLYMAAPIATSAIRTNRTNVVGNGLRLKSTINRQTLGLTQEAAEEWQKKTEAEFELWASRKQACDATGINDFYSMQQLAVVSWLGSGDVFALTKQFSRTQLLPYGLRLHLIEADRVRTPSDKTGISVYQTTGKADNGNMIYDGVEVDSNGAIVAYHIANTHPFELSSNSTNFSRVSAYGEKTGLPNVLHVMESERPEQYRGVPYLAQVIEPLLQMRRYTEAEIMAALVQSFYTAFVTTKSDSSEFPFNEVGNEQPDVSDDPNEYELGPGTVNIMEPGEDVKFASPTHPQTGFDTFMRALAEQVGAALEVPADLLLKAFNSSYSASRAALLEAWKAFRMRRVWLTNDFCRPTYEIWLTEAVALGRISAPGFLTDPIIRQAYLGSEWIGPSQGQLDPVKEIAAAVMAIDNGLSTREQETIKLNGSQFSSNVDQLAVENEKLRHANGEGNQQQQITNSITSVVMNAIKEALKENEQSAFQRNESN